MEERLVEAGDAGGGQGDLYGDLWVLARDLDPTDGGGNGEVILDSNGQIVPIGLDTVTGETFPIHLVQDAEGDWEVPPELLGFVQEIDLGRASIIRSPDSVVASALEEALAKIEAGTIVEAEASGRIMVDGVLIDSPRECLALYKMIMDVAGSNSWTEVQASAAANLPPEIVSLLDSGWNPTGLLAGVFSKFTPVSLDAVITAHTFMGVNEVTGTGDTTQIDYFGFTDGTTETFNYDRVAAYGDTWVQWYQDIDGDPSDLEAVQRTLLDAVWGRDRNGDGINDVGSGKAWSDKYLTLSSDGLSLEMQHARGSGLNDWAQSVEDSRAVILLMHESIGAHEVAAPPVADDVLVGTPVADLLTGWGGNDLLSGLKGDDTLEGGDDMDTLDGGKGADLLDGGNGDDRLNGGMDNDSLQGGNDNDRLVGGEGDDILTGGGGADLFVFRVADLVGTDTITDFSVAELDMILLNQLDADLATAEDEAFVFVGYVDFTGTAGELRAVDLGGAQRIEADTNGDGLADLAFVVDGTAPAEAGWFAL